LESGRSHEREYSRGQKRVGSIRGGPARGVRDRQPGGEKKRGIGDPMSSKRKNEQENVAPEMVKVSGGGIKTRSTKKKMKA